MKSKLFRILGVVAVVAMLTATMTVAPALAVSTPALTVGSTTISATTAWTILFTINTNVPAGATAIVITFPTGASIAAATATIGTTSGIGTAAVPTQAATITKAGLVLTIDTATANLAFPQALGVGTIVQVIVSGVVNPGTTTACGVTVATSSETTAVASNTITPTAPVVPPPPGIVSGYNAATILLVQSTSINTVILTPGVTKIVVEPGTYAENVVLGTATMTSLASLSPTPPGTALSTIIAPAAGVAVTISVPGVTLNGFTVTGVAGSDAIAVTATSGTTTISNCIITSNTNCINNIGTLGVVGSVSCSTDTFTTTGTGVGVRTAGTGNCTITIGTFTVPATGTAILLGNTGTATVTGTAAGPLTELGAPYPAAALTTITGPASTTASSTGISILAGVGAVTINNTTFTGVAFALPAPGPPTITFTGNTLTNCGRVVAAPGTSEAAIKLAGATAVSITANTITSSKYAVAAVAANGNLVNIMFNDLTGSPTTPMTNVGTVLNATHNFWGTGVTAPTSTATVSYANPLGVSPVAGSPAYVFNAIAGTVKTLANATAGVTINTDSATVTLMGSASYATCPVTTLPASTYAVQRYYDAFLNGGGTITINFYGTTAKPVTASSQILFWNAAFGRWDVASPQGINLVGNYVFVTLTATSSPANTDVTGTPFALVNIPPAAPGGGAVVQSPALGAADIAIDTTFTWPAVANAVSYEFQIGTDSGFTGSATISTSTNAYKPADNLEYNTTYWWQVRSVNALGAQSSWTTVFFTTAKEPAVAPTTSAVTPTVIVPTVTPTVIVTQSPATEVQVIPNYLLWAVIAVGAVLVIAVIVLIVRTRRIS